MVVRTLKAVALLAVVLVVAGFGNDVKAADPGRGELLYNIGGCTSCHTAKDGPVLAGGDELKTPFGSFYPPNITPDADYGIGGWSDADFLQAMQEGLDRYGLPFYPAFPYTSYTRMSDQDLLDLKAYLDTIEPVAVESRGHDLKFPFNIRYGLWAWQWWYFQPGRFEPDPQHDEVWNRGAYLVLGPGHCSECHTPRDFGGGLDRHRAFAGTKDGPQGDAVPNITPGEQGIGDWDRSDLTLFFQLGMMPDGDFAGGEMGKVISNGTSKLPESDLEAIATFLESLPAH